MRHHAEALAARFPPLMVAARRVAQTVAQGLHGRRQAGMGETFWQFRQYQSFDSVRRIDWRRSARSRTVFVRETEWEAAQSVWIWRDPSPSMAWRSGRALPEKRERAELLALALAALLTDGGESVAALGEQLRPMSGRDGLNRFADHLSLSRGQPASVPPLDRLPRHAEIVLVGDFLEPIEDLRRVFEHYVASGVRGHLLQVTDPAEEGFPYRGRIRFEGTEAEPPHLLRRADLVREDYAGRLAAHRAALADLARLASWSFSRHVTSSPPEAALLSLYVALSQRQA